MTKFRSQDKRRGKRNMGPVGENMIFDMRETKRKKVKNGLC